MGQERRRMRKKKSYRFSSYPIHFRKFQKNSIKVQKTKKKHHSSFIPSQNGTGEPENEKKNKHSEPIPTQPGLENFKKKV